MEGQSYPVLEFEVKIWTLTRVPGCKLDFTLKVIEIQKRWGTKIIPNHAFDKIRNPRETRLPPSRPSLTSYALEYGGALMMIRVYVFLNDFNCLRGWQGLVYIGRSVHREPLDQTDLKNGVDAT